MPAQHSSTNRSIRIFVSSTFRDMMEERDELMSHCWPELRSFCRERHVELTEVDLRWGIAEEQSTRRETLKLCLDEINKCLPFFICLLGERYGWIPDDDAFTADLLQEQDWLRDLNGKSVTELEILHGVLNNPDMAVRAFFYFREPKYIDKIPAEKRADYLSENETSADKQTELKDQIRKTCSLKNIPLLETYPDPKFVALMILEQLKTAIEAQFPIEGIPDPLTREALDHEAFAEVRCRTYIGRPDYFEAIDQYCECTGKPLLLMGESGSGKSALIANWVHHWREKHPKDFVFQHYIGGTSDSSVHWKLRTRLMSEIKKWCNDELELPKTNDEMLRDFPLWLSKARLKAEKDGVKFIVILDALNQLEDKDHAFTLGWLQTDSFRDSLKLIVSTLPSAILEVLKKRGLQILCVELLKPEERGRMIVEYLRRFGKTLDQPRVQRLANAPAAANPLYLKIVLDELRITGTFDNLDERLNDYLKANDIPTLLQSVLARYQRDYERDRPGLVRDALGLVWSARRGLSENEILQLLRPDDLPQLPLAVWSPLRSALEDNLIDRGGILNFNHDFLRSAVRSAFVPNEDTQDDFRIQLAEYFETLPTSERSCDEAPWLLWQVKQMDRLHKFLLNIDCFIEIINRDEAELRSYWRYLDMGKSMGQSYYNSFRQWKKYNDSKIISSYSSSLGVFLLHEEIYPEAKILLTEALDIAKECEGELSHATITCYNNLSLYYSATGHSILAMELLQKALDLSTQLFGRQHPQTIFLISTQAIYLVNCGQIDKAVELVREAIDSNTFGSGYGHPEIARQYKVLAICNIKAGYFERAENNILTALEMIESALGVDDVNFGECLQWLAICVGRQNRYADAYEYFSRALEIFTSTYGSEHPNTQFIIEQMAIVKTRF